MKDDEILQKKSDDLRDTQFACFAKLLRQEMFTKLKWLDFGFTPKQQESIDEAIDHLIAQRTYDFAEHLLKNAPTFTLEHVLSGYEAQGLIEYMPDLTEWPERE